MVKASLSSTRTIGVHIGSAGNPFYSDFAYAALKLARARGYDLVVGHASPNRRDRIGGVRSLKELGVAGLITFSNMVEIEEATDLLIPVVVVNEVPADPNAVPLPGASVVEVDAYEGGRRVADHLVEMGRHRPAAVLHHLEQYTSRRMLGFFDRLVELGCSIEPQNVVSVAPTIAGGRAAAERLRPRLGQLDGAFCFNDAVAVGFMNGLVQAGASVPYEVAVVGWDNISVARLAFPRLSTVDLRIDRLAGVAVDAIVARVEGREPAPAEPLPVRLVVRESSDSGLAELRERHRLPLWRVGGGDRSRFQQYVGGVDGDQ